jgi:hypothetical protein
MEFLIYHFILFKNVVVKVFKIIDVVSVNEVVALVDLVFFIKHLSCDVERILFIQTLEKEFEHLDGFYFVGVEEVALKLEKQVVPVGGKKVRGN